MNKLPILLAAVIAVVLFVLPSQALTPIRVGEKNFEHAWYRLMHDNREDAVEQFATGAEAFAEALAEEPRSRSTNFPSNLVKAGMSFYYAGRYEEAVSVLGEAYASKNIPWESALYAALSWATLGETDKTLEWLGKYRDLYVGQHLLAETVAGQLDGLGKGTLAVQSVAATLDAVTIRQYRLNQTAPNRALAVGKERCDGAFWWRYFLKPCKKRHLLQD